MSNYNDTWKEKYDSLVISEQIFDINKQSPENFIDDLKMKYIRNYLPEKGIIVEVGAGSGRLLTRIGLENKEYKLIGFDYGDFSVKLIKENLLKYNLNGISMKANAFYIPIKSNSVDVVMSGGLLEHFDKDEIKLIIREMLRILKPNGVFYADIVPEKSSLCRPIILTKQYGGHENNFSMKQWRDILLENGLSSIQIFSGCIVPPDFYGRFRSGLQLKLMYKLQPYINKLDDTSLSNLLGFMYYVFATKDSGNELCIK